MADPVAIVERILKIGLKIKQAADKVHQNQEVCQEIRKRVLRFSAILSKLQRQTAMMEDNPEMGGALQDLEATLERALELITACQERGIVRRLVTAGDLGKQLRGVNDDIMNKVMLATFAVSTHTTIILLTNQAGVHRPPRQPEDTGLIEASRNHSTGDVRSRPYGEKNNIPGGSGASFAPLLGATLKGFMLYELKAATNRFSHLNVIGSGGSVTVYKGLLNDKSLVAIKKLRSEPRLGWAHTYNQLLLASKLQHRNIVKVLGYAHEDEDRSLMAWLKGRYNQKTERRYIWVEEYMPMGNLHEIIYNQEPRPDWSSLFRIIEGVAQAVHYLHEQRVLHLDLKPANILLDSHMNPKITDFDLARVLDDNKGAHVNPNTNGMDPSIVPDFGLYEVMDDKMTTNVTGVAGTFGYLAPEYVLNGTVSGKRDVYAFGITLLETVGCIRKKFKGSRDHPLGQWAWRASAAGRLEEEFDPKLCRRYQLADIKRCVEVGLLCAQMDPMKRPSMADIVARLNGEKELPTPKKPEYITLQDKQHRQQDEDLQLQQRKVQQQLREDQVKRQEEKLKRQEEDLKRQEEKLNRQEEYVKRHEEEVFQQHREDQLKRREEKLKRQEEYLKRHEEEVLVREVQLLRQRALIGRQEVLLNLLFSEKGNLPGICDETQPSASQSEQKISLLDLIDIV